MTIKALQQNYIMIYDFIIQEDREYGLKTCQNPVLFVPSLL